MTMAKDRQARMMATAQEIFIREVENGLPQAHSALSALKTRQDTDCLKEFYRFAHTLKGSGQMVGLQDIADPAFEIGTALQLVTEYNVPLSPGLFAFLADRLNAIHDEVIRLRAEAGQSAGADKPVFANKKVLIVDDDPVIIQLVKERLAKEDFKVTVCYNTLQAEQVIAMEHPDIILLDIILPGENGVEFCRRIRSAETTELIPIIFFSVKGELRDKLAGFATGADDYLPKPFEMEELVARIHAILNRMETLGNLAWRDGLTGLYNRQYLDRRLSEETLHAEAQGYGFSLAMLDLDTFKNINDAYGHSRGDNVLKSVAAALTEIVRETDVICRYGGDEFAIIFPKTGSLSAQIILERLQHKLAANTIVIGEKAGINITLSIGMASFPKDGRSGEELLSAADSAMYQAKRSGGNKVVIWGESNENRQEDTGN